LADAKVTVEAAGSIADDPGDAFTFFPAGGERGAGAGVLASCSAAFDSLALRGVEAASAHASSVAALLES